MKCPLIPRLFPKVAKVCKPSKESFRTKKKKKRKKAFAHGFTVTQQFGLGTRASFEFQFVVDFKLYILKDFVGYLYWAARLSELTSLGYSQDWSQGAP